ncbi:MAG: EAL domain-containing protein [Ruminococcaceae bacterium]|nr:EAL domain-containing protein [Oscillospiraceae bacterium]
MNNEEKLYLFNGKRQVLIVDDEEINRSLLGNLLENDYELIYASNGSEAIEQIKNNKDTLSLILLDLIMPGMNGLEVLKQIKSDFQLKNLPVIVITSDRESEVESLNIGASDFIPKPYPQASVITARINRTVELSEDRMIINATECDPLTELFNREYFYRYVEQYDAHHKSVETDAAVVNINHFNTVNERFGTDYGDMVLRLVANKLMEYVIASNGMVCRSEADKFLVYCPHGTDFDDMLKTVSDDINSRMESNNRIRLRIGVYEKVNRDLPVERRFDRANMACDSVKNSISGNIGIYNSAIHEKELFDEQLIEDFREAIEKNQFTVYYQPKYNVQGDKPVLTSAEALVRWNHPTFGFVLPSEFIPLFEENGLIQKLDNYVWNEAAKQISEWKERFGITIPISVNISRVDVYDPMLVETFKEIVEKNGITSDELLLEITESAYTEDPEQIIKEVKDLRELGFKIEMDDFGTGYSSLNMISELPIDVLKLDMQFVRQAFSKRKDTKLIEIIIEIAEYLRAAVVAEGVETQEQMASLKEIGCNIIQGYYFSKPVPPEVFEGFIKEKIYAEC